MPATTTVLPIPPPGLQEATKNATASWQQDLEQLFNHAKDRFPDVVWEFIDEDGEETRVREEVWGHKAIVYARAPPSFQNRYFSIRPSSSVSPLPYSSSPTGTYPTTSAVSLGLGLDIPPSAFSRTPSPFRSSSPTFSTNTAPQSTGPLLRLSTSINPTLFSNELEYLYTGQGFGEAFEFLFDSADSRDVNTDDDADAVSLRIDKLRKDLVFMWRSRLYSDVRIALTGNFSSTAHENTTAIFSSHRFILVSRSPYFHTALLTWPTKPQPSNGELPTLTLPSPPFTPASLHFTLGFLYTGTLIFSHRTYDLSTAFAILRAAHYLSLPTLLDEIQARIAHEMLHGLFHAFLPFPEYERLTGGRWGTGGCRCRQCARRAPRVLEFALADDVRNLSLERGARRALVGLFGEGWCTTEFASLPQKIRETLLRGVGKRTTPQNVFPLLFTAEHALGKLSAVIEPWADTVKDMILVARKNIDELLVHEAEACFSSDEWVEIMQADGIRFEDAERVEWAMAAVLRGLKEPWAAMLYQTLVSCILLRPHPTETNAPLLPTTSHIRVQVEETRVELLKWIGKRWIGMRQERGFDTLEGWALTEISDYIEVPTDDLLNPLVQNSKDLSPKAKITSNYLRPLSTHPHTSKVDTDSDVGSVRLSVVSRQLPVKRSVASVRINSGLTNSNASIRSLARSDVSEALTETTRPSRHKVIESESPAKRIANAARNGNANQLELELQERPDSKLMPSSTGSTPPKPLSPQSSVSEPDDQSDTTSRRQPGEDGEDDNKDDATSYVESVVDNTLKAALPLKKTVITRTAMSNASSRASSHAGNGGIRPQSSASSIRSHASTIRKSTLASSTSSLRLPPTSPSTRPASRGSTRPNLRATTPKSSISSRPSSSISTRSSNYARPASSVSTTSDSSATFRTANSQSGLSTPSISSRTPSTASTANLRSPSLHSEATGTGRSRRMSGSSISSVTSTTGSVKSVNTLSATSSASRFSSKRSVASGISNRSKPATPKTASLRSVNANSPSGPSKKTPISRKKLETKPPVPSVVMSNDSSVQNSAKALEKQVENGQADEGQFGKDDREEEKENIEPEDEPLAPPVETIPAKPLEHRKSESTTSTMSVATLKRKGSTDTITRDTPAFNEKSSRTAMQYQGPTSPLTQSSPIISSHISRGATLDIGIPCIISSRRKRFKAYARYIGEVEGEVGPWVGVEVPIPLGDSWMGEKDNGDVERQWNDGTWGGIRYFEIGSGGSEWDYGDDRFSRKRRVESTSVSRLGRDREKGALKREGDQLIVNAERSKRMRSASPATSDASGAESRGLFVRPQQVLYVIDAVGEDL